jgi:class 3 adenylate cyclase
VVAVARLNRVAPTRVQNDVIAPPILIRADSENIIVEIDEDFAALLQTVHESQRLLIPILENNDGILLKIEGDSYLVIFRNVSKAIVSAVEMQKALTIYNKDRPDEEDVLLCVGLGYGKMLRIGDADVFGSEVNAASKLGEDIAKAGEILVTESVKEACKNFKGYSFEPIKEVPSGAKKAYKLKYSK